MKMFVCLCVMILLYLLFFLKFDHLKIIKIMIKSKKKMFLNVS